MNNTSIRLNYIDNLRVLACFLVLLTHSTMPSPVNSNNGFWAYLISFIGSPSSELFLALSGTVLLPIKSSYSQFYKRRFSKLLPPLFIWSIFGLLLYRQIHGGNWTDVWNSILHIPFQPAIPIYWFVYAIAGLYLFAPIISPWLRTCTKTQIEWFISLWLFNMLIPWINFFFPNFIPYFNPEGDYYWILSNFGGFLGYWIMGYYLNRHPINIGFNRKWLLLLSLSFTYPIIILLIKLQGGYANPLMDNLQIGSVALVALYYTLLQKIQFSKRIQSIFTEIAKYSFGIYLTHIYIARELYWGIFDGSSIHLFPRTFIIALLTLFTGYILTRLLSFLPKGKYIVGI